MVISLAQSSKTNWKLLGHTSWWSPNLPCTGASLWCFSDSGMGASIMFSKKACAATSPSELGGAKNFQPFWVLGNGPKKSDIAKNGPKKKWHREKHSKMIDALHGRRQHGTGIHIYIYWYIKHYEFAIWCQKSRTDPHHTGCGVCNDSLMSTSSTNVINFPWKTRRLSLQSEQNDKLLFRSCHDIPICIKNQ